MNYKQIQILIKNNKITQRILTEYAEVFKDIDRYAEIFIQTIEDPITVNEILDKLTGYFMSLNPIKGQLEAIMDELENKYIARKVDSLIDMNKTLKSGLIERHARIRSAKYKKVYKYISDYIENCKTGIYTCQSKLKNITDEYRSVK